MWLWQMQLGKQKGVKRGEQRRSMKAEMEGKNNSQFYGQCYHCEKWGRSHIW